LIMVIVNEAKERRRRAIAGYQTLLGGALLQMFNGCFFLWANISQYILSYMYQFDADTNINNIFYVDVVLILLNCIGHYVGSYLLKELKWNPKKIIALAGSVAILGIWMASFATNMTTFLVLYGGLGGIGCGINYMIPLVAAWEHFPDKKGLCTGVIIGAYGLGSFIFTRLSTRLVNPNDAKATIEVGEDLSYFEPEVANRVP